MGQHGASAEKTCQIVIISHNSAQFEKLNISIVCYITSHQNSWILKFILTTYKVKMFFLKQAPLFGKKWNVVFIWLGSTSVWCVVIRTRIIEIEIIQLLVMTIIIIVIMIINNSNLFIRYQRDGKLKIEKCKKKKRS